MERKLKKPVIYSLSAFLFTIVAGSFFFMTSANSPYNYDQDYEYVSKLFDDGSAKVSKTSETLLKPYTNDSVKIVRSFYDYKGKEEEQKNSIINYDQTYIQNNGVSYGNDEEFDVISVLSGTVTSVKEDKLQGKMVTVENENNVVTTYKSLSEVLVKENDVLDQGTIIGKSGKSNIDKDLGTHVLFEMTIDGTYVNAENYYGSEVSKLKVN